MTKLAGAENDVICVNDTDILIRRAVIKRECWSQTIVQNLKVVEVPTKSIVQTEAIHWPLDNISKRPLLLVKHRNKHFIADGNHRYVNRIRKNTQRAYILDGCEDKVVIDDNIAVWIHTWLKGEWSWSEFKDVLIEAAEEVATKIADIKANYYE